MRLLKLPGCSCYDRKGCTVHPRDTDVAQEPESSYMYPHGSIMSALISCGLVAVVIINITSPSVPTTPFQAFPFKTNNRRCRRLLLGSEIDALRFVMGTVGLKSGVKPASGWIACRVGINASCGATPFTCHLKCSTTGNRTIYAKCPSILNRTKHLRWYDMYCSM